jgi:hypothetical protein
LGGKVLIFRFRLSTPPLGDFQRVVAEKKKEKKDAGKGPGPRADAGTGSLGEAPSEAGEGRAPEGAVAGDVKRPDPLGLKCDTITSPRRLVNTFIHQMIPDLLKRQTYKGGEQL